MLFRFNSQDENRWPIEVTVPLSKINGISEKYVFSGSDRFYLAESYKTVIKRWLAALKKKKSK